MKEWVKIEGEIKTNIDGDLEIEVNNLCDDCKQEINHYMMTDRTWEECAKKDEVLCFQCFSVRLDREIFPADFMECDMNEPFLAWIKYFAYTLMRNKQPKSSGPMAPPG